jgi:hypothetical protein
MDGQKLYTDFYKAYCLAYPEKDKKLCQTEANKKWNKLKEGDKSSFSLRVNESLKELTILSKRKKGKMLLYFSKLPTQINKSPMMENHKDHDIEFDPESSQFIEPLDNPDAGPSIISSVSNKRSFPSRAQEDIQIQIDVLNVAIVALLKKKTTGWLKDGEEKELKEKQSKLKELEKKLNEKKNSQKRQKKFREERKNKLEEACKKNPELKNQLKLRANKGRPSIEADQPVRIVFKRQFR